MLLCLIHNFFWIITSVADILPDNPGGIETLLVNGVSTFFNDGKPAVINCLRKLRNPPSWLVAFIVVPFIKIPLFSKD